MSWVKGKHTFKFGGEVRYMLTTSRPNTGSMYFNFTPDETRVIGPALVEPDRLRLRQLPAG